MFKCTVCQKLHNTRVEYCDCGNDMFEEVAAFSSDTKPKMNINPKQMLSYGIFAACIGLSGWVIFGMDSPAQKTPTVPPQKESAIEIKHIPPIDKIWDDSTAYNTNSSIDAYKSELQRALYSNLEETSSIEEGRCRIEFKISRNGKLTHRRLYKEKGGNLFNNLVIRMMKRTTNVKVPPDGYHGMKFTADVYTENGEIKVVLK